MHIFRLFVFLSYFFLSFFHFIYHFIYFLSCFFITFFHSFLRSFLFLFTFCFSLLIFHFRPFDSHYSSLFFLESSVNFTLTVHLIKNMNFSNSKTSSLEIRHRVVILTTNLNCIFLHRKAKQEKKKNQWESRNYFHPMPMGITFLFPNIGFHHCSAIYTMIISVEKKNMKPYFSWRKKENKLFSAWGNLKIISPKCTLQIFLNLFWRKKLFLSLNRNETKFA